MLDPQHCNGLFLLPIVSFSYFPYLLFFLSFFLFILKEGSSSSNMRMQTSVCILTRLLSSGVSTNTSLQALEKPPCAKALSTDFSMVFIFYFEEDLQVSTSPLQNLLRRKCPSYSCFLETPVRDFIFFSRKGRRCVLDDAYFFFFNENQLKIYIRKTPKTASPEKRFSPYFLKQI